MYVNCASYPAPIFTSQLATIGKSSFCSSLILFAKITDISILGECAIKASSSTFLQKSLVCNRLLRQCGSSTNCMALSRLLLPALLWPISTLMPSWNSTTFSSKLRNPLIFMFLMYIFKMFFRDKVYCTKTPNNLSLMSSMTRLSLY